MTKVLVIGNGAIGACLAVELEQLGLTPRFIGRAGPVRFQATFDGPRAQRLDFPAPTAHDVETAALAMLAVRAFDLEAALAFTSRLGAGIPVVPLSNGATWDIVRRAAKVRPDLRWRLGFCTVGVSVVGETHYALRSRTGEVSFGPLDAGDQPLAIEHRLVESKGLFRWHPGIAQLARRKWLYNTVINSLTAARRMPKNGELLGDLSTLSSVFAEAMRLAQDLWGPLPQGRDELFRGLCDLIEKTAENENSMARDVRLRRRTESDFLAGLARDEKTFPLLAGLHRTISTVE